jgi:hypothetical protein
VPAEKTAFSPVHFAASRISAEIDAMLADLPADANLEEVAADLIAVVAAMNGHTDFVAIFTEAILARRALTELGINLDPS